MESVSHKASRSVSSLIMAAACACAAQAQEVLPTIDISSENAARSASGIRFPQRDGSRRSSVGPIGARQAEPSILKQATQNVSVIDRQQIELTNPTSLLDVLGQAPGVSIARSGGIGGQIYLRGFSSNSMRSPLYIDGNRLRGRNTLQLNYFAPEEIEQVEVIRGPASVLYGSDALTGLVNVVMRQPQADSSGPFRFTGGGASFGFGSAATALSTYEWVEGAGEGFSVRGGVSARKGVSYETPQGVARNSDYRSLGGSFTLGYAPTPDQRISATFRGYTETDGRAGGVGGAPGYPFLNVRQSPNELLMGRIDYSGDFAAGLFKHVEASAYVNYFDTHVLTFNASNARQRSFGDNYVVGPLVVGGRALGVMPWNIEGWGSGVTKIGGDAFHEARPGSQSSSLVAALNAAGRITAIKYTLPNQTVPDSTQTNGGVFALHEWTPIAPLTLSAGGRLDYFNTQTKTWPLASTALLASYQANSNVDRLAPTGSMGAILRLTPELDLVGNVATSFRQPTNSELFNSTATTIPNPDLKPETGLTYEGGLRFHGADATASITGFHSIYHNLILAKQVTYLGLSTYTQNQNVGSAEVDGIEVEERWQATPSLNISGNLTYLRGTNISTQTPLPYIAPLRARVGLQFAPPGGGYSLMGVVNAAAGKTRIDTSSEYKTSGYAILNLYSSFQLGALIAPELGDTTLSLGLENVFNTPYVDAATFANVSFGRSLTNPLLEPGRNFTARLSYRF